MWEKPKKEFTGSQQPINSIAKQAMDNYSGWKATGFVTIQPQGTSPGYCRYGVHPAALHHL